ncbi:hypothetical protein [Bosea sp. BH3]|uniref:hypothetical protein n=1 Tax=Bosea sp. BH3 TaxID=2871701 RepID=UPI0021CB47FE|nr:hypothetical protein [Bosea sp. BH3]MCU4181001.1 hypothetical protein [Bosea sp. BH3]
MKLSSHDDYRAATARAASLGDAPEGTEQAEELQRLVAAIRDWDAAHKGENSHGPEPDTSLLRPDDLPFSGLPGNMGKLRKD